MSLSKRTVETLIDLVEIKLSCMEVFDREDAREQAALELAVKELSSLLPQKTKAPVVNLHKPQAAAQSNVPQPAAQRAVA
jgi:hypothetical protein